MAGAKWLHYAGHAEHGEHAETGWWPPYAGGTASWPAGLRLADGTRLAAQEIVMRAGQVPRVVILSGCETGALDGGAGGGGRGMSLSMAFLVAGAEVVVATTGVVGDAEAREEMRGVYEGLDKGWLGSRFGVQQGEARSPTETAVIGFGCDEVRYLSHPEPKTERPRRHLKMRRSTNWLSSIALGIALLSWKSSAEGRAPTSSFGSELERAEKLRLEYQHLQDVGDYRSAIPKAEEACIILRRQLGDQAQELSECLHTLGVLHRKQGNLQKGEHILDQSLFIREMTLGADHIDTAETIGQLGSVYLAQGRMKEAEISLTRSLSILTKALGSNSEHLLVANALNRLGTLHGAKGEFADAKRALLDALRIQKVLLPPGHLDIAMTTMNLGNVCFAQGEIVAATTFYEQTLEIYESTLGPNHARLAYPLTNLGTIHFQQGRYKKAEPLHERALRITEKELGHDHINNATHLNNLGILHTRRGQYRLAEKQLRRAISIREAVQGANHPELATNFANLAQALMKLGRYAEAEQLGQRALLIDEVSLGPNHAHTARDMTLLGDLHKAQGRPKEAEILYRRAFELKTDTLGLDHAETAHSLHKLGRLYWETESHARAEPLLTRALEIQKKALGPRHPDIANSLSILGIVQFELGNHEAAIELHRQALNIEEENTVQILLIPDDDMRRLKYMNSISWSTHHITSLHMQGAPNDEATARTALTTVLRRKGRVQDVATQSLAALRRSLPADQQHILDDLSNARFQYSAAAARAQPSASPTKSLGEIQEYQNELWHTLGRHSPLMDRLLTPPTIVQIQHALPKDGALIEYVQYYPCYDENRRLLREAIPPRFAAYLLFRDHIEWFDLGPTALIEKEIATFRRAILHQSTISDDLYDLVLEPIAQRLTSVRTVFIAPDGELNRVPFGALHDGSLYFIERYSLHVLTTGRDMLRPWTVAGDSRSAALAVANPTGAGLPGTEREADLIADLFPHTRALLGNDATETGVRRHKRPRLMHIGTHGFYEKTQPEVDLQIQVTERMRLGSQDDDAPLGEAEDVMLRSGLQLTKVDTTGENDDIDDGRLTAYEISGLDLRGTELVVLSACGTGLGTIQTGEGVMGLRRAFAMAGAQTVVTSLWDLGDESTPKIMELYYRKLAVGVGRGEAMQQAQLELLRSKDHSHPFYWAPFVVVGEWAPLSGTPLPAPPVERPPAVEPSPRSCQASTSDPGRGGLTGLLLLGLLVLPSRRRSHHLRSPN